MPSLGGAIGWLNSEALGPAELQRQRPVVLVNFWTLTYIGSLIKARRFLSVLSQDSPLEVAGQICSSFV
jgi:hypothetical protein